MVIRHEQEKKALRMADGARTAPVVEAAEERKLAEKQKQLAEEAEKQRARLATEGRERLQESLKADKLATEAQIAATRAASRLKESIEEAKEVEEVMRTVHEDIIEAEAAGKKKDAAMRRKHLVKANSEADQGQEPAAEVGAAKEEAAQVAAPLGAGPANPRALE
jgi:hypothetical protein